MEALLIGWFLIGSMMMGFAWAKVVNSYWKESGLPFFLFIKTARWHRDRMISFGLVVNSFFAVLACSYVLWDIFFGPNASSIAQGGIPVFYALALFGMVMSKVMLLWAKSVDETAHKISWPWWAFLVCVILWGLVVMGVR